MSITVPRTFKPTHETAGLPGYPAVDLFGPPGTLVDMAEAGTVTRISGHDPKLAPPQGVGGPWGLSVYYQGASGNVYYLTHFAKVAPRGSYAAGQVVGVIGDYPGLAADHVHVGLHKGDSPEAHYRSVTVPPGCYFAMKPPPPPKPAPFRPGKPAWQWLTGFIKRGKWTHPA